MKIIFMGSPDFAVPTLAAVLGADHDVVAVYAQPPRAAGRRGLKSTPTPVQTFAEENGITVRTPTSLKDEAAQHAFADLEADAAVVVAYGLLLPEAILRAPRLGCFNVHASDLPRWRGAAPIHRAIMAGDTTTAICIMRMERGLDTGPVVLRTSVAIDPNMTTGDLHDDLSERGGPLLVDALAGVDAGTLVAKPQSCDGVTYATKIAKTETRIDFATSADTVHNHIRGLSPVPGAWFPAATTADGERLKVLRSERLQAPDEPATAGTLLHGDAFDVACGDGGAVRLVTVQRAGGKSCTGRAFLNGCNLNVGDAVVRA